MAATAQPDPYTLLIRKIGWSVGLENTFERVDLLVRTYLRDLDISASAWRGLMHDGYGVQSEHIGDFFQAIGLISIDSTRIRPLPILDALGIAYSLLADERLRARALTFILGSSIVLADGDIFLNLLAAGFRKEEGTAVLRGMILQKRHHLLKAFATPAARSKIIRIISIEQQTNNPGSAAKRELGARRLAPLTQRSAPLSATPDPESFQVSADYFRKVPVKRRGWACSMGLWAEPGQITERGKKFLDTFAELTKTTASGGLCYWPHADELARLSIQPEQIDVPAITLWDHIRAMFAGLGGALATADYDDDRFDMEGRRFAEFFSKYRGLAPGLAMLRRELSAATYYHAVGGVSFAMGDPLDDLPFLLNGSAGAGSSNLVIRDSRNFGLMLSVKG